MITNLVTEQTHLIKQIYPKRNISIYEGIRINSTTSILEMLPCKKGRILYHINRRLSQRKYYNRAKHCPMIYNKILCHACYKEIGMRNLYVSKSSQSKSKFYHIDCATEKLII